MLQPHLPSNPLVFLDIRVGDERGRMVIELRQDVVANTAEKFRILCTGEHGLTYKNTKFHKVQRLFMAQGGDLNLKDGSSGHSIYGKTFDDDNFKLKHIEGAVSMVSKDNSQFFICAIDCPQLDDTNVVFGQVLRGFSIISEMENYTTDEGNPTKDIIIEDCGELSPDKDWGYCDNDVTSDKFPPFTNDWSLKYHELPIQEQLEVLSIIKNAGNFFFNARKYVEAARKYKKSTRYFTFFKDRTKNPEERKQLESFHLVNLTNLAAVQLKLKNYEEVCYTCQCAIKLEPKNFKALYRRGLAQIELKNYELALEDLKRAHQIIPDNKIVLNEFERAKSFLMDYRKLEKLAYRKIFQ